MIGAVGEELGVVLGDTLVLAGVHVEDSFIGIWLVVVSDVESVMVPNTLLAVFCDVFVHCLCRWRSLREGNVC